MAGQAPQRTAGSGFLAPHDVSLQAAGHLLEQEGPWEGLPRQVGGALCRRVGLAALVARQGFPASLSGLLWPVGVCLHVPRIHP